MKKKKSCSWIRITLMCLSCILLCWSSYELCGIRYEYNKAEQEYEAIRDAVKNSAPKGGEVDVTESPMESTGASMSQCYADSLGLSSLDMSQYETAGTIMGLPGIPLNYLIAVRYNLVDFDKLQQINPEVVGWITIEGTNIDYPVLHSQESNEYYLRKTITGEFNNAGSIFVDYKVETPFSCENTIIHGHNQRNKTMFHELSYYEDKEFFNSHRHILIYLPSKECVTYEIYSFYISPSVSVTYDCSYIGTEYQLYLDYTMEQSWYDTGVKLTMEDKIITLSTCTNGWEDERYVVHARKIS